MKSKSNLQPRHVNWWWGKRISWLQLDGKGEAFRRGGIVTEPKKLGKEIQLTVATDDGWLVYLSANQVEVQ